MAHDFWDRMNHLPVRIAAVFAVCLGCPAAVRAQSVLYATSGNGSLSSLYSVNPTNGASTLVGEVRANGGTTPMVITGLAFHPGTGVLYGVTGAEYSPERQLVTINPQTAEAALIGSENSLDVLVNSVLRGSSDITFASNGTLYSWVTRGGPLATVDLGTGTHTLIGTASNGTQGNGLAFTPNGTLYVAGPAPGNLFTVSTSTGAITTVAALSNIPVGFSRINAMASDGTGLLFVTGSSNQLVTIDPITAAMTLIGTMSFGEADALVFAPVPEPATHAVLAAMLAFGFVLWRRTRKGI